MKERFPLDNPQALHMMGEEAEKDFIRVFGTYVRLNNVLSTFDRFEEEKETFITPAEEQDYRSLYLNLHDKYRNVHDGDKVEINDDLVFEIELIKQVDINIDFIIQLIEQHRAKKEKDKTELMIQIQKAVGSSPLLRNKSELIEEFVRRYAMDREVSQQWAAYVSNQAHKQLDELIADENLNPEQTEDFMRHAFHIGEVERNGDRITKCLPPLPLFTSDNKRAITKRRVLDRLCDWFDRFFDIFKFE
jgi:type I restriction enzyme R subunit